MLVASSATKENAMRTGPSMPFHSLLVLASRALPLFALA